MAQRRWQSDSGAVLVEFALTSWLFFMLVTGVMLAGMDVWRYNLVQHLAQEGARWASVRSATINEGDVLAFVRGQADALGVLGVEVWPTWSSDPPTPGSLVTVVVEDEYITGTNLWFRASATMVVAR